MGEKVNFNHDVKLRAVELYPLCARGGVSPNMVLGQLPDRPALLIKLVDDDGCFGWGEIWSNFPPRANIHKANLVEDVVSEHIVGAQFASPSELIEMLRSKLEVYFLHIGQCEVFEHILAGLDTAAWDLCLRSAGQDFASFMKVKPQALCYASSLNPDDLDKRLADHAAMGQKEFKLKIGFDQQTDLKFVEEAAQKLPEDSNLMVDSNQSWGLETAIDTLKRMESFPLLFAEEPIRADSPVIHWEKLVQSTDIPLAAGENLYGVEQFMQMVNAGVRYLQPDVAKWGGVSGALELVEKLPDDSYLWPHFMGSAIGQQAALAISAAIGASSKCEMDVNENQLRTDLCERDICVEYGKVHLPTELGLLDPPTIEALREHTHTRNGVSCHTPC